MKISFVWKAKKTGAGQVLRRTSTSNSELWNVKRRSTRSYLLMDNADILYRSIRTVTITNMLSKYDDEKRPSRKSSRPERIIPVAEGAADICSRACNETHCHADHAY